MDILQEKMQDKNFSWKYRDISFEGKNEKGYYIVCVDGLETDYYDFTCYFFKDYEKLKKCISSWYDVCGETFYDYLSRVYEGGKKYDTKGKMELTSSQ